MVRSHYRKTKRGGKTRVRAHRRNTKKRRSRMPGIAAIERQIMKERAYQKELQKSNKLLEKQIAALKRL